MAADRILLPLSPAEAARLQQILDTLPWVEGPADTEMGNRLRVLRARYAHQLHHQEPDHGHPDPHAG